MYAWMWRHLPGPWPLRLLLALVVVAAVVYALFRWAFPVLAPFVPGQDVDVGG